MQDSQKDRKSRTSLGTRISAFVLFIIGIAVAFGSQDFEIGTLRRMGPGYFPLLLGLALCVLSMLMLLENYFANEIAEEPTRSFNLRVLVLPLLGIVLFAGLIKWFGFVPAVIACAIIAGLAEKQNRPFELVAIALAVALFSALVFVYALGTPVRLFVL